MTEVSRDVPQLPAQYVDRPTEQLAIENLLGAQGARVVIFGLPGMGKTALATKAARGTAATLQVDRVLWADFGEEPDIVTVLRSWCQELGAIISAVSGTPGEQLRYLRGRLSEAAAGKLLLFVLDDVGPSRPDLEAARRCLIDDENCRYLVTTIGARTAELFARNERFRRFHVAEMDDDKATELLEKYAEGRLSLATMPGETRGRLLRLADGLPLGLMVLGLFLGEGLAYGDEFRVLQRRLADAESLVRQEADARLRLGHDSAAASIDTILMARWQGLPGEQREALLAAAAFRGKPHTFSETAWAGVLEARQAAAPEVAEEFGRGVAMLTEPAASDGSQEEQRQSAGEDDSDGDDEDLRRVAEARERLGVTRMALQQAGLLEQPQAGEPSFTMHSLIVAFLRRRLDVDGLKALHEDAARYYRGWLDGFQENHPASSPFESAYRMENRRWLAAMVDLCYHLCEAGNEDQAVLQLATLFFDAFWWWGEFVPYQWCDELLRLGDHLTRLGGKARACLGELRKFKAAYPVIDLDLVPPDDPHALPRSYQDGTDGDWPAVLAATTAIRDQFAGGHGGEATEDPAQRHRLRLRMLTAIYIGEANRIIGDYKAAADGCDEALTLLARLGQDGKDDDWIIPYVYAEMADLHVRAGRDPEALAACAQGVRALSDESDESAGDLDGDGIDHEVTGCLWQAAGNAHWIAGRLTLAWRCYAWSCFHTCAAQLWPRRMVWYESDGGPRAILRQRWEYGADEYTVTSYKLHVALMLERLGELWTGQRRAQSCDGIGIVRDTLAGGPEPVMATESAADLAELAATSPDKTWEEVRELARKATGLAGLALPLVPWERLTGRDGHVDEERVDDQRRVAEDLAGKLRAIWATSSWTLGNGPGQGQGDAP